MQAGANALAAQRRDVDDGRATLARAALAEARAAALFGLARRRDDSYLRNGQDASTPDNDDARHREAHAAAFARWRARACAATAGREREALSDERARAARELARARKRLERLGALEARVVHCFLKED